uniref:WD40 domain-containing protein n=1 Tax=Borely moumouvirus TaxID=2712067 RepID=A0A6G6ADQ6_9VIRU
MDDLVLLETGIFSDLSLEISDGDDVVHMNVHKCILFSRNLFFRKLLSEAFKEKNEDNITLWVENANFTKIIIESFYGKSIPLYDGWKDKIMLYFMQQYFQIDNITFPKVDIIPEEYSEFIQTLNILNYPIGCIKYIKKYLPKDYDLSQLPKYILDKLLAMCEKYKYIWINDSINILPNNSNKLKQIKKESHKFSKFTFYPDVQKFITYDGIGFFIHIISKNELISEYSFDVFATGILRYQSKKYILFTYRNDLHLYDIENKNEIVVENCKVTQISIRWCEKYHKWFQNNYKYLVLELNDQTIDIYNLNSREKILSIESEHKILDVLYTDENKQLIYRDNVTKMLQIRDIESETCVILPNQDEDEKAIICYSECNNYILSFDFQNNRIKVWSTINHEIVNIIEIDDNPVEIFKSTKFSEIIICYENYTKVWDIKTGLVVKTIYDTQIKSIDCVEGKDYELYERINHLLEKIE